MESATQPSHTETQTASGLILVEEKPWYAPRVSEMDWYFPPIDPLHEPLGPRVVVQLTRTKFKSAGGIHLVGETQETIKWNSQIAKVISMGQIAYRHRDTNEPWPEGAWCKVGDYVRVPRWGGDRWEITPEGEEEPVTFVLFNDHEIIARATGDVTKIKAFIL
jgi:co-chaperonin GroES (HSP10)